MQLTDNPESYPAWASLTKEKQDWVREVAKGIRERLQASFKAEFEARLILTDSKLTQDELLALWCILESHEKTALKRQNH